MKESESSPEGSAHGEALLPREVAAIYEQHFPFVWRNARRLGVPEQALDDVVQDVFLVVCRRLAEFEGRSTLQTWLFGIVNNIVTRDRRTAQRRRAKLAPVGDDADINELPAPTELSPHHLVAQRQAADLLYELLAELDDEKRTAYILVDLEQQAPLEVAEATGVNVNTIHSRVRAARQRMEAAIARHHAHEKWRTP